MLNHVHLLISEPRKGTLSTVLQMVKQGVSRKMRKRSSKGAGAQLELGLGEDGMELKSFWQKRFYDFNVYRSGKVKEKLNYMHANPVISEIGEASEGLAVEQLEFLCEGRKRVG